MTKAIGDYDIVGLETTLDFCKYAINHDAFVSGDFDTHFVKHYFNDPSVLDNLENAQVEAAAVAAELFLDKAGSKPNFAPSEKSSEWFDQRS